MDNNNNNIKILKGGDNSPPDLVTQYTTYFERLYFLLNLSTRPPVSTSFCLPVKNGWQFEQISTRISLFVEAVSITAPQAHLTCVGA